MTVALATSLAACDAHTVGSESSGSPAVARPTPLGISRASAPLVRPPDGSPPTIVASPSANGSASNAAAAPSSAGSPSASPGPRIIALSASPAVVHAGGSIAFHVRTSADVASVTGTVSAYTMPFTRTSPGRFELAFAIPTNVPFFFHGTYAMNVTALGSSGASASRSVAITFQ